MPSLDEITKQIEALPPEERAELASSLGESDPSRTRPSSTAIWLPKDETPLVIKTPGVCGGSARLIRTRIPVWLLEGMRRLGWSEARILKNYPTLHAIDLVQAWAYVERNREEIDQEIARNEEP